MFDLDAYLSRIGLSGRPSLADVHVAHAADERHLTVGYLEAESELVLTCIHHAVAIEINESLD